MFCVLETSLRYASLSRLAQARPESRIGSETNHPVAGPHGTQIQVLTVRLNKGPHKPPNFMAICQKTIFDFLLAFSAEIYEDLIPDCPKRQKSGFPINANQEIPRRLERLLGSVAQ